MPLSRLQLCLLSLATLLIVPTRTLAARRRKNSHPDQRDIKIINESKVTIDVRWIDPTTHQPAASNLESGGLVYGGETGLNSYAGHNFLVEELPNTKTQKCLHKMCRKAYFSVTKGEDQVITVNDAFLVDIEDSQTRATKKAKDALQKCQLDKTQDGASQLDALYHCLETNINATIIETQEEIDFQKNVRKDMASRLVPYACGSGLPGTTEQTISSSRALVNTTWRFYDKDAVPPYHISRNVQTLFETPTSSIRLVEQLWTEQECKELVYESKVALRSSNVPLAAKQNNPVVKRAIAKIQDFTKTFLMGSVFPYEHDPLVRLYTSWPSDNADDDDECELSHDGTCIEYATKPKVTVTTPYNVPTDAATLRIFCEIPKRGGAFHFPQAGIHVHLPEIAVGSALFITYADPLTGEREEDSYLDEMVACPVVEGALVQAIDHYAIAWS